MGLTMDSDVRFVKGVGEARVKQYHKLGIFTVEDLLFHLLQLLLVLFLLEAVDLIDHVIYIGLGDVVLRGPFKVFQVVQGRG